MVREGYRKASALYPLFMKFVNVFHLNYFIVNFHKATLINSLDQNITLLFCFEILNCLYQSFIQSNTRLPIQFLFSQCYIRLPLFRVVTW